MSSGPWLLLAAIAYLGGLFLVARYAERRAEAGRSLLTPNVYALSLAVYCTSWTFFGSVGRASSGGLSFLTIYLGPTLMLLCVGCLEKMLRIAKQYRITSIADFIASRYGKSQILAGLVTIISVLGVIPYIALQLKAVAAAVAIIFPAAVFWFDPTLVVAGLLAAFTIVFGTRHLDATERHEGMVAAIAVESLVKLLAFLAVGVFVTWGMFDGMADLVARAAAEPALRRLLYPEPSASSAWVALILLSALAVVLLPRQFQVMIVENTNPQHLRRAVWLFPLYLLLINVFVLPVALGGLLQSGPAANPDTFVLTLPLTQGAEWLAGIVFIGGLSAATGMVVVESIALSTMVANDLLLPCWLRSTWLQQRKPGELPQLLLMIRRLAIVGIIFLGYLYYRLAGDADALVGIGLISFAAVAQFAPALFGGMYWRAANRHGALCGLLAGFGIWLYTLLLPALARSGWIDSSFVDQGLFGCSVFRAQALFGLSGFDPLTHALWWSLLLNAGLYILVSLLTPQDAQGAVQAERFVAVERYAALVAPGDDAGEANSSEPLQALLIRLLGRERAIQRLAEHALTRGVSDWRQLPADAGMVAFAERELAAAIGAASARVMVASVTSAVDPGLDALLGMLDEASQVRAYSRALESKQLALEQATSELRAANLRLQEVDRLKDDFISTVTHELRTPLTSIRALSEILQQDPRLELAQREQFLGIIVSETERLSRLINQVLDLAKLESGRAEWVAERIDLALLVAEVVGSLRALFAERQVALIVDGPAQGMWLEADRDRLTQVLVNLLSNAVKFVPADVGRVVVTLARNAYELRVTVADNGPGLTAEECNVIFEKFRQGGDTLTGKPQGTGLGLPISRQIVEHFGGKLWVESRPGAGARFIFTVPSLVPDV